MPDLARITNTFFVSLINRLGIRPPPAEGFQISSVVQPVSIVDSDISIPAVLTTFLLDAAFTAGELTAPVANTILADTGALPAGNYQFLAMVGMDDIASTSQDFRLQRRDAANGANIWSQLFSISLTGTPYFFITGTARLLLNERLRIITKTVATAGETYQGTLFISQIG